MAKNFYDRLTALDFSFLALEKPQSYMHVASTQIYDAGPLRLEDGGVDFDAFRKLTSYALQHIPRYRQKLATVPLEGHPVWVDDPDFNLDYHLRHTALPRPGSDAQLKRLSSRIMQQHLDRSRPLWEMWLVEGLEGGRFAVISKVHHCMIDGISGVDLMKVLMSPSPEASLPEAAPYRPRPAPSSAELLFDELRRRARLPFALLRGLAGVREVSDLRRELAVRARSLLETLGQNLRRPSETPLNRPIGPHRRFDWLTMELETVKGLRRELGGSLNDVVLALVAGALRRFLGRRGVRLQGLEFRVLAPVSVRGPEEEGALGNRVSAWVVPLPLAERDPRRRLAAIRRETGRLKRSGRAVGPELLARAADWSSSTLLALGARHATRLLPFNLVVTNVPGPQMPLYTLGARMREVFPQVPLVDFLGLGIALMSYDGKLCWGLNADYDLVPDLEDFVADLEASLEELQAAAR